MQQTILYVGLDVDDTGYRGAAVNKNTGDMMDCHCLATLTGLMANPTI